MNSEDKYKAEDFLSGNIPKGKEHLISENERDLSANIIDALKSAGPEKLSHLEIEGLWDRIENKVKPKPQKFQWKPYTIAASLILIMSVVLWYDQSNSTTDKLLAFAAQNVSKKSFDIKHQKKTSNSNLQALDEVDDADNIITTNDFNTLVVGSGKRSSIYLPDSTKVWLSSSSKLIYPVSFKGESREVYLEGEAYFDVKHIAEKPFFVRSKNMEIKVLGTQFYVSSSKTASSDYVVLVEGSVVFSTGTWLNKTEVTLTPGQKVDIDARKKVLISKVETKEFEVWRNGYMDISSETLEVIIARLAKYYNITIRTEGLNLTKDKFSGRLDFQRSAEDVLNMLCSGTPYVYNQEEGRMDLKRN